MAGIDDLIAGRFFDALNAPFATAYFQSEMFYLFLFLGGLLLIFMKNRSVGLVSLTLLLGSYGIMPYMLPTIQQYLWALMFFGIIGLIYALFKGR